MWCGSGLKVHLDNFLLWRLVMRFAPIIYLKWGQNLFEVKFNLRSSRWTGNGYVSQWTFFEKSNWQIIYCETRLKSILFMTAHKCPLEKLLLRENKMIWNASLNSSFSEKATQSWKISHLFWRFWVKTDVLSKHVGDFFQILRPYRNVLTLNKNS